MKGLLGKKLKGIVSLAVLAAIVVCALVVQATGGLSDNGAVQEVGGGQVQQASAGAVSVSEDGSYTSRDEVALYVHTYGKLPGNFITKKEAKERGWVAEEKNLAEACPGKSIGGDRFYNDDGLLPDADGRCWTECDIDYVCGARGAKRVVFSNDGLVYYTHDHYKSFEQLY